MNRFRYVQAGGIAEAIRTVHGNPRARFIAGGTNLIDLMKDEVESPAVLVDLNGLGFDGIQARGESIVIGALARMSDVADASAIRTEFPVVAQAPLGGASAAVAQHGDYDRGESRAADALCVFPRCDGAVQ